LDFVPKWRFEDGLREFLSWAGGQELEKRNYEQSLNEMRKTGLMHG
jgi:dTDP-L-rhamnose 4-epimerase